MLSPELPVPIDALGNPDGRKSSYLRARDLAKLALGVHLPGLVTPASTCKCTTPNSADQDVVEKEHQQN